MCVACELRRRTLRWKERVIYCFTGCQRFPSEPLTPKASFPPFQFHCDICRPLELLGTLRPEENWTWGGIYKVRLPALRVATFNCHSLSAVVGNGSFPRPWSPANLEGRGQEPRVSEASGHSLTGQTVTWKTKIQSSKVRRSCFTCAGEGFPFQPLSLLPPVPP